VKVTGETFSLFSEGEGAEEVRCQNHSNFQVKGPLPDRTLESFIKKAPTKQFLIFGNNLTEFTKNYFLIFIGGIFQVERQGKRVISLFFYSIFFV